MEEDQREFQFLPCNKLSDTPRTTLLKSFHHHFNLSSSPSSTSSSLDLQLSISLQPFRQSSSPSDCVLVGPIRQFYDTNNTIRTPDHFNIEALKWQASEQFRLASLEKAYADRVRELTRREMELAQSDFARARHLWESAREDVEKAERLKERSTRLRVDSDCMEITCQSCHQRFLPS